MIPIFEIRRASINASNAKIEEILPPARTDMLRRSWYLAITEWILIMHQCESEYRLHICLRIGFARSGSIPNNQLSAAFLNRWGWESASCCAGNSFSHLREFIWYSMNSTEMNLERTSFAHSQLFFHYPNPRRLKMDKSPRFDHLLYCRDVDVRSAVVTAGTKKMARWGSWNNLEFPGLRVSEKS